MLGLIGALACGLATLPAGARWLRVAQREHYLAGSSTRFAWRWWSGAGRWPVAPAMAVLALGATAAAFAVPIVAVVTAVMVAAGPPALGLRGRTAPLRFTPRLRRLGVLWVMLQSAVVVVGVLVHRTAPLAAVGACAVPVLVDVAAAMAVPLERRLISPFVRSAQHRLVQVHPLVVGITGSFGKTSTKQHLAHLVAGARAVVASPASFNNRAGLARAVNEQLTGGTEVFVAEMGTYGRGEIAELCRWCPPEIAILTAIGPVHLERFGSEEAIVAAKAEITATARIVIVNADDPHLVRLAGELARAGKPVVRCSAADPTADVCVTTSGGRTSVSLAGVVVASDLELPASVQPTNLACALAGALEIGVPTAGALARLSTMPTVANRLAAARAPSGIWVVDDTFNSNPRGSRAALAALAALPAPGRRVVVTPGMVELGRRQFEENRAFARAVADLGFDLVIVGRTNAAALRAGGSGATVRAFRTREDAVAWVRATLGPGDAVLYENDLPDHYR